MVLRRLLPLVLLPAAFTACPGEVGDPESAVVVGVQTEDLTGRLTNVHVVAKVDGELKKDETSPTLPKEIEISARAGARLEVLVDGLDSGGTRTIISRRAEATVPFVKKLLRMPLEQRCLSAAASASGGLPDPGPPPVVCDAASTCVGGRCVSPIVPFELLEEYVPNWPATAPDLCRPANAGPPEVVLGTGQTDYGTLSDGQTLQLEKGPQGGHHIWMAVRMRNMKRSGSRTALTAKLPDDPGAQIFPAAYVFSFERDEGTYCKLYGLRFQLDSGASDLRQAYKKFLGKQLVVSVEVADGIGQKATATKTIKLADKILCPDGTTTTCVASD
jgi:hypothetical protein